MRIFSRRLRRRSSAGFTLVEAMLATSILAIGLLGAATTTIRCSYLQRSTGEYIQDHLAARDVLERLHDGDIGDRYQEYRANPNIDLGDRSIEVRFPVEMLERLYGGQLPTTLRYRDLDGDGGVEPDGASTESASLLPVRITVRRGDASFQLETLIVGQ